MIYLKSHLIPISTLQRMLSISTIGISLSRGLNSCSGAINTPGLSNQEISSKQPYILADTSGRPTEFGTPPDNYVGRGPPTPLNSQIPLWDFGRYDGYPQRDSVGLRDPMTFMTTYYKQPQLTCATSGKTLYCCFPGEIMCEACEFDFFRLLYLTYLLFPPVLMSQILSPERRRTEKERQKAWEGGKKPPPKKKYLPANDLQIGNVIQNAYQGNNPAAPP